MLYLLLPLTTQTGDSVSVLLDGPRIRMLCLLLLHSTQDRDSELSVNVSLGGLETQNKECLFKGYIYPFPMRGRLQFGPIPFQCYDWVLAFEVAHTVWPTLLFPCGTHLPNLTHS